LLIQAKTQERLIGTTAYGIDPLAKGMVFTMNTDGSNYSPKKEFMQSWGQGVDVVDGKMVISMALLLAMVCQVVSRLFLKLVMMVVDTKLCMCLTIQQMVMHHVIDL
jgi:hypothetical protein